MVGKILRWHGLVAACRDVTTPVLKVGRENLHVIAAAAGQDFDHRAVVPDAEEAEHLERMSVAIARHIGRAAMGGCEARRTRAPQGAAYPPRFQLSTTSKSVASGPCHPDGDS